MSVGVTSAILASVVSLTVAIAILFRRPRRPLYRRFSLFTFALFLWHALSAASFLGDGLEGLQLGAALLIPPTAIGFFREILRDRATSTSRLRRVSVTISILLFGASLTPIGDERAFVALSAVYIIGFLALVLRGLWKRTTGARTEDKKRLRFLFHGGTIALLLAMGDLVPGGGLTAAMGHVAATFYVYFLYQSILSRRVVDLVEILGKAAVLAALTVVLAAVYALLVLWVGQNQQGLWLFNTLVASFVILIVYDQVRPLVEETTAKLLFRERYELRQLLRRLVRSLRTTIALPEMRQQVLEALHGSGRATHVSIYLQVEGDPAYSLYGYRGQKPPEVLSMASEPSLFQELRRERRPILLEHLLLRRQELPTMLTSDDPTLQRELDRIDELIDAMRKVSANVVLPMLIEERVVGLLCIGVEHVTDAFSTDELAALLSLAEACAIVMENSHEYEKHRERDRLVAIGEMAAGMAHEIRNPLGAIKGAAQCLEPSALPKDAVEFVDVIIEEVDRLNGVVSQFLEYARPYRGNPIPVDVNEVVTATLRLLAHEGLPHEITVRENLAEDLPRVSVDPEQLKQVLINLVQNAIQAMPKGGTITISSQISMSHGTDFRDGEPRLTSTAYVLLRVRDTGEGIRPEDLPRIFVPFFTTKTSGTGLGLAISQRIVENAGGRLEVTSRLGEGSVFTIRMPASPPPLESEDKAKAAEPTPIPA